MNKKGMQLISRTYPRPRFNSIRRFFLKNKYVPYILTLVVMKVTVMVLLANSNSKIVDVEQTLTNSLPVDSAVDEETQQIWQQLDHLEDIEIEPTAINRTTNSSIWLIFNRVPRSGGLTLVYLLKELEEKNGFAHQRHQYRTPWNRLLIDDEMKNLVTWFEYQHHPRSYDRHFLHVNFTRYQKYTKNLRPTYINLLRDPAEREYSVFRSRRSQDPLQITREIKRRDASQPGSGMEWYSKSFSDCVLDEEDSECDFNSTANAFSRAVPYFCGQDTRCLVPGSRWALQRAKFIIEHEYAVVGILERMNQTLAVLERYIPRFFSGAQHTYYDQGYARRHENKDIKNKPELTEPVLEKLKQSLASEYELYEFCQQRLYSQFQQ